ncbi:MAG TPA: GGDEF domain-containing protein [Methylophilus sp.]
MPVLDLNSAILASIGLSIMMVMVLRVYAAHDQRTLVMRWIWGWLMLGLGLAITFLPDLPGLSKRHPLFLAVAFSIVCLGLCLYINGIRRLRGFRIYRFLSLLVLTVLLTANAIQINLHAPLRLLLFSDLLVMAWVLGYGYYSLLGAASNAFIQKIYRLCALLFGSMTLMAIFLLTEVALIRPQRLDLFQHWSGHAYMLFYMMLSLMAVTCLLLLSTHIHAQHALQAMATVDGLTGVLNRRGLQDAARRMQAVSQRLQLPMALLVIDLDYFKKVNDVYGHLAGDHALRVCADTIRHSLRGGDVIARYGGEEFCILLPNTGEQEASVLAERIRKLIAHTPIQIAGQGSAAHPARAIKCTVSIGSVSSETLEDNLDQMFAAADRLLYQAKQDGRNRVVSNLAQLGAGLKPMVGKRQTQIISP